MLESLACLRWESPMETQTYIVDYISLKIVLLQTTILKSVCIQTKTSDKMPDNRAKTNSMRYSLKCDLQFAIRQKNIEEVKRIVAKAKQLETHSMCFIGLSTPLGYAIYHKFEQCVRLLLDEGFYPNELTTDRIGRAEPPLCVAIRMGELCVA